MLPNIVRKTRDKRQPNANINHELGVREKKKKSRVVNIIKACALNKKFDRDSQSKEDF